MRTLVYCTAYSPTLFSWNRRYRTWLDAIQRLGIADQILIVDDGSPVLPGWLDMGISSGPAVDDALEPRGPSQAILHHFTDRLGRAAVFDCPGWYRSYGFGIAYAVRHGFDRVVHVESDVFLLSDRIRDYFAGFENGWAALWSERYVFPELAIQVAAGDGLSAAFDFTQKPYDHLIGRNHELLVPFTHVERGLLGDRYGETHEPIPAGLDYVCQIDFHREASYYWWIPGNGFGPGSVLEGDAVSYDFTAAGNSDEIVLDGWSGAENGFRWMTGYSSGLRLPPLEHSGDYAFRLNVFPMLVNGITQQKLQVVLNGHPIDELEIDGDRIIGTMLPGDKLHRDGSDVVSLIHPVAVQPARVVPGTSDTRILSIALRHMTLAPVRER